MSSGVPASASASASCVGIGLACDGRVKAAVGEGDVRGCVGGGSVVAGGVDQFGWSSDSALRAKEVRDIGDGAVRPSPMRGWVRRGGRGAVILVAGVALLVVGGCSDDRTPLDVWPTGRPEATAQSPLARSSWQPGQSAMSAAISGTLTLGDDGCVRLVEQGAASEPWPVLWPVGWIAQADGSELLIRDPSRSEAPEYRTGVPVTLGGGFLESDRYQAQACASGPAWQVVG